MFVGCFFLAAVSDQPGRCFDGKGRGSRSAEVVCFSDGR